MLRCHFPFQGTIRGLGAARAMYPWGLKVAGKGRGGLFLMILPSSGPRRHLIDVCALNLITGVCEPLAEALGVVYTGALGFAAAFLCLSQFLLSPECFCLWCNIANIAMEVLCYRLLLALCVWGRLIWFLLNLLIFLHALNFQVF